DYMEQECLRAQQIPGRQNAFKRLHLNIWTEQASVWLPMDLWDACDGAVDVDELEDAGCYGGLDLASTTDMAAYSLVFPGAPVRVLMRYFLPEADLRERVLRDRVPYDVWADQGLLTLTPGNAIDYAWIKRALLED